MSTKKEIKALNNRQLTVDDFKNDERVKAAVDHVQAHPKIVSDVLDSKGNQYVHLVQKGGGVLGVALVGYVYVLEQAGIRFLKLAGTSAGAINTSLMAVQEDKSEPKSDYVIEALSKLDMFRLVDGHPFARNLIKSVVKEPDFMKRIKKMVLVALIVLAALLVSAFVLFGLQHRYPKCPELSIATSIVFVLTGLYFLCAGIIGFYFSSLMKRLKTSGFGVNPGDFFYDWIKKRMADKHIENTDELIARAKKVPELKIRETRQDNVNDITGDVVFIASELVTQNKFELPRMAELFRTKENINEIHPAGFVRASMAIPVFFESYYVKEIPCTDPAIIQLWTNTFNVESPPNTLRFVDGGILSNFPINLFYNKDQKTPRLPTFGIDLDDSKPEDKENVPGNWSLPGYIGRMFNTVRFYYDKDFSLKNKLMNLGVGKVPVSGYNWLNFFLTNEQKIDLFAIGAEAAKEFLDNFKWEDYKDDRETFFEHQQAVTEPQ